MSTFLTKCRNRPISTVFVFALTVRLPSWIFVSIYSNGYLFGDDKNYLNLIRDFGENRTSNWDDYQSWLWSRSLSFLYPGGLTVRILGYHPILILSLSVIVGSALASVLTMLLKQHVNDHIALTFGLAFACMPSQILWSSLLLKDSYIALGIAVIAYVLVKVNDKRASNYFIIFGLTFLLLIFVQRIRAHTLMVVCIALVVTALLSPSPRKSIRLVFALLFLLVMPVFMGGEFGGKQYLETLTSGMEDQRAAGAVGANTAVVDDSILHPSVSSGPSDSPVSRETQGGINRLIEEVRYLPSGYKVMLLDPTVSQLSKSKNLYFAFVEHLIWYPMLLLAFYGAIKTRKWSDDLLFAGFIFLGTVTMWALTEGNFGTAYRHRTEFVWIVFLFAGIGAHHLNGTNRKKGVS